MRGLLSVYDEQFYWYIVKLQYTLSKETTDYLTQPTFDMWHWEPNEVGYLLLLLLFY